MQIDFGNAKVIAYICTRFHAAVAQLVEHWLPKPRVAGSSPVCRSQKVVTDRHTMAVFIIITIITVSLLLIATENVNHINKAAVAMFMGVICWLLYIGYGTMFVVSEHQVDFLSFLTNHPIAGNSVKEFIANSIFVGYVARAAEIVLFILATMTIVEVLNNNGCFDFLQEWLRTRSPRRYLWIMAGFTFLLSCNLDNLTTVCLMLAMMHTMVADEKQRMIFGSVIIISANCGGACTVIGDITSLTLWTNGVITPSVYFLRLILPIMAALLTVILFVSVKLPHRLRFIQTAPPYRGDDTVLVRWQRLLMLFIGIGGLWFIPTFHSITLLPPFLGALCVLSLLWIVNELCNRSLLGSDKMVRKMQPMALQYVNIQNILFFIGISLTFDAVSETGALGTLFHWCSSHLNNNVYAIGSVMGLVSGVFNSITVILANVSMFSSDVVQTYPELAQSFGQDGIYWPLLSFSTALGGSILSVGSMAGITLMRMEGVSVRWYIRHISGKVLAGWIVGLLVFYFITEYPN